MTRIGFVCVLAVVCIVVRADYRSDGLNFRGFLPSASYQRTEDQLAEPSARVDKSREDRDGRDRDSQADRTQRFGISTYGNTGPQRKISRHPDGKLEDLTGPYGGSSPGLYGPVKIDLGGVLLGSILGFGAVLVLPKLMHVLSYGYGGGYGRSAESSNILEVTDMLNKLDDTLGRYNIDSASCMQRLACSYVQLANENMVTGNATDLDALLSSLSSNSLIRRMLDGTSILDAISAGKTMDTDCHQLYPKCKMDKKTVVKVLTQLVPS